MTHLAWVVAAIITWVLIVEAHPIPAVISASFFGALITKAAYEHEIKKSKDSEARAWRYFYEEKEQRKK